MGNDYTENILKVAFDGLKRTAPYMALAAAAVIVIGEGIMFKNSLQDNTPRTALDRKTGLYMEFEVDDKGDTTFIWGNYPMMWPTPVEIDSMIAEIEPQMQAELDSLKKLQAELGIPD
jgi:hypothetical protein